MIRITRFIPFSVLAIVLLLPACDALSATNPSPSTSSLPTLVPGQSTAPAETGPVTVLATIPATPSAPPATASAPTRKGQLTIAPGQGGISTSVVQVAVKGSGFPAGQQVQVNVVPETQPAQGFGVVAATVRADGTFDAAFVMPADQPDIAGASKIKVIAVTADGTTGAQAEFTNTDGQGPVGTPALDYVNPVFGYRLTIPAGWRARQPTGAVDLLGIYNPSDKSQAGSEPIVVRAMVSPQTINGANVKGMTLEQFARAAYPVEFSLQGQAELKSVQPLQPASGAAAFQSAWHLSGQNPYDVVISYFDFDKTIDGRYYRAIQLLYDTRSKHDAEYSAVVNSLSLVTVKSDAASSAARSRVQEFMGAYIAGKDSSGYLDPQLKGKIASGSFSLASLLGAQNVPSKFDIVQAASFSYANQAYAVVKATMDLGGAPGTVQFQLVPAGNTWLIDEIISLQ